VLDFGIIADDAGVQGLEAALDNAVLSGADVLITSGVRLWQICAPVVASISCAGMFIGTTHTEAPAALRSSSEPQRNSSSA
jgi:hypothetical protein